jgi:hypothetical protein
VLVPDDLCLSSSGLSKTNLKEVRKLLLLCAKQSEKMTEACFLSLHSTCVWAFVTVRVRVLSTVNCLSPCNHPPSTIKQFAFDFGVSFDQRPFYIGTTDHGQDSQSAGSLK